MSYKIHKLTYSEGRAYRYHILDDVENLRYVAEHTGMLLPSPTRLVEFFDPAHNPVGRFQSLDVAPWRRGTRYGVFVGEEAEEPYAVIQEGWRLVDILLLRLPRYEVQLGQYCYIVRGSRYGDHFYEIFRPREKGGIGVAEERVGVVDEERVYEEIGDTETEESEEETRPKDVKVGRIQRPMAGPSYIVESDAAPLRQALLVLASLVILIDMNLHS